MIQRQQIINLISNTFIHDENVNAFWLEGADALGKVDEYSDIDIVLDVNDGHENTIFKSIENKLSELGILDLNVEDFVDHPKIRTKFYHIENTNKYLIIDFSIQSASRKKEESHFFKEDIISSAQVVFDKIGLVQFKETEKIDYSENFKKQIDVYKSRFQQHSRVLKYVERGLFLEASMYYGKYVAQPIVALLRMKYTPDYSYLHLIHISDHIPQKEKEILEKLYKISSLEDISENTKFAQVYFKELLIELKKIYTI